MKRMRVAQRLAVAWLSAGLSASAQTVQGPPPLWAYPINPPAGSAGASAAPSPTTVSTHTLPGSTIAFTTAETRDLYNVPDWRPDEHSKMPQVVAHGRKPGVQACGYCHLPSGDGRPENASLAGLSYDYILAQMADLKTGRRSEPVVGRLPASGMVAIAKAATHAEVVQAAKYFSKLTPTAHTQVIESDLAPKAHVEAWIWVKDAAGGTEPVGQRIIETPDDFGRFELRDGHTKYLAYVPRGSIAGGRKLVAVPRGEDKQICADCHGADFRGAGKAPRLAGRSPSYLVRQLYDFQAKTRRGPNSHLMAPMVAGLSEVDMIRIGAYLASRAP